MSCVIHFLLLNTAALIVSEQLMYYYLYIWYDTCIFQYSSQICPLPVFTYLILHVHGRRYTCVQSILYWVYTSCKTYMHVSDVYVYIDRYFLCNSLYSAIIIQCPRSQLNIICKQTQLTTTYMSIAVTIMGLHVTFLIRNMDTFTSSKFKRSYSWFINSL